MLKKFWYGLAALTTAATAVVAQPANDLCENATLLGSYLSSTDMTPFDTTGATNTPTDVSPLGCLSAEDAALNDIWFSYTAYRTGRSAAIVSASGPFRVSVYSACGGAGDVLGCGSGSTLYNVTAGQTVYIRISGDSNTPLTGGIRVNAPNPTSPVPVNDLCTNATPLQYDTPVAFITNNSTNTLSDVNPSCSATYDSRTDIWYSYTPNVTGTFPITIIGGGNGAPNPWKLNVYTACGGTGQLLACLDGTTQQDNPYILNVPGTAGQTVYIRLADGNNFFTHGSIQIGSSLPPYNDWCTGSADFGTGTRLFPGVPEAFDTAYATTHYADTSFTCLTLAQAAANDVWYQYQASSVDLPAGYVYSVTVTPSSPGFIPNISLYGGCGASGSRPPQACVRGNVGDSISGFGARVVVKVFNNGDSNTNTYNPYIRVGGDDNTPGNGIIQVDGLGLAPSNDDCANAAGIADGETISYFNDFATNSSFGSTCPGSDVTADNNFDLWYRFVPNQNGQVTFSTCGSAMRTHLSTYNDACDTLVECGTTETCSIVNGAFGTITVPATAGTAIRLRVASYLGYVGDVQLHAQFSQACAADFNHVNGVTVQDIFDFLTAWLAGSPTADFNGVNGVTVQDIFDFLTAWLAGC